MQPASYPEFAEQRNAWITGLRPAKVPVDPRRPVGWFLESERSAAGEVEPVLTVLLANRECPWKCVYCDLWRHTLDRGVGPGDVPEQIRVALRESGLAADPGRVRQIKLYNAGSFFDSGAIPSADLPEIASLVRTFDRLIVECHPSLVGERVWRFRDQLAPALEVAMGLESVDPAILGRLNKGMTLDQFRRSAGQLAREKVALRVFVLVQPPFSDPATAAESAADAVSFAVEAGATVVSLIPTRPGNGAMDALQAAGQWRPPSLEALEGAHALGLGRAAGRGRVFADLWDLERFSSCPVCLPARRERLGAMNGTQQVLPSICCHSCWPKRGLLWGQPLI